MMTNRKFERAATLRSRVALLAALAIHIALISYLLLRNEKGFGVFDKADSLSAQTQPRP